MNSFIIRVEKDVEGNSIKWDTLRSELYVYKRVEY